VLVEGRGLDWTTGLCRAGHVRGLVDGREEPGGDLRGYSRQARSGRRGQRRGAGQLDACIDVCMDA